MNCPMSLMASFSQRDRFLWHKDEFHVMIPDGARTVYHPRASLAELKGLLTPKLRLTRSGNISAHQPPPPPPKTYAFYLAQLIHYGLDFCFLIEDAQRALEIEIRLERLQVPPGLRKLEKELRQAHERKLQETHETAASLASRQQLRKNARSAVVVDESENEPDDGSDEVARQHDGFVDAIESVNEDVAANSSPDNETQSFEQGTLIDADGESAEESDVIQVAPHVDDSASFSGTEAESSHGVNKASENEEDNSDEDSFVDRLDFKRIKLEKADEKVDSILRSIRERAPSVARKKLPLSQLKGRHIVSQARTEGKPIKSEIPDFPPDRSVSSSLPATPNACLPSESPNKRPSWTIPVRSPLPAQQDTPKSVTFSQVRHETPTAVGLKDKDRCSSSPRTALVRRRKRAASMSSNHSQDTPLRSILKKTTPAVDQPAPWRNGASMGLSRIPHGMLPKLNLVERRKRKRKSRTDGEGSGLGLITDGTYDLPTTPDSDMPFITSDLVNGKSISTHMDKDWTARSQPLKALGVRHSFGKGKGSLLGAGLRGSRGSLVRAGGVY